MYLKGSLLASVYAPLKSPLLILERRDESCFSMKSLISASVYFICHTKSSVVVAVFIFLKEALTDFPDDQDTRLVSSYYLIDGKDVEAV